jgi:hypothetical protein
VRHQTKITLFDCHQAWLNLIYMNDHKCIKQVLIKSKNALN